MAKINHKKAYSEHYGRIDRYARMVDAIFENANQEAAKIALATGHSGGKLFAFDDYPQTRARIKKLQQQVSEELESVILNGETAEWDYSNVKNDALVMSAFGSKKDFDKTRFARYFNRNESAFEAFQERQVGGLGLSQRVWQLAEQYKQDMELALDVGLRDGRSAAELSRDIRHFLNNPTALFRRVRDEHGQLALSKKALAYNPGSGVYRSAYKNAMRLTRTEINMAYRMADQARWAQLDFVTGYEVRRSGHGYDCSLCDSLAGKYPKDFVFSGWHPHCRCYTIPILKSMEEFDEDTDRILAGEEPIDGAQSKDSVTDVPEGFKKWVTENKDRAAGWKSMPYFIRDNTKYGDLGTIYAAHAKKSAEAFGTASENIAKRLNVSVTPVNIKSDARIMEKARLDYNGDIGKVKDIVRNTFIVPDGERASVIKALQERFNVFRIKEHHQAREPLGYSGTIMNVRLSSGVKAEIQVNSAVMIYGKELHPEKFIGEDLCKEIKAKCGLQPGLGHKYYERYRVMNRITDQEEMARIERDAKAYYNALRSLIL